LAICSGAGRSLRSSSGILDAGLSECSAVRMGHEKDGSAVHLTSPNAVQLRKDTECLHRDI
jgi:hypothetical protein